MKRTYRFLILNGPNLGHIGSRQPEIYGHTGLDAIPDMVESLLLGQNAQCELLFYQSNHEGALIDRLEQTRIEKIDGIVLNAGAFTHTSLALADCLAWIKMPCVEVHISNILAREEPIRHKSLLGRHTVGMISGFGVFGYALAVQALISCLENK